uniref:Uncharacterized protein n=1 Tax=Tetranychus urticae TaxID=32264 RepID=T1KPN1_TETUR
MMLINERERSKQKDIQKVVSRFGGNVFLFQVIDTLVIHKSLLECLSG